jgi:hypothetical protein
MSLLQTTILAVGIAFGVVGFITAPRSEPVPVR